MIRRYTAILDRFEGEDAVLLVENDGVTVDELLVDRDDLPEVGRRQDAVFDLRVCGDSLRVLSHRPDETNRRRRTVEAERPTERSDDEDERLGPGGTAGSPE